MKSSGRGEEWGDGGGGEEVAGEVGGGWGGGGEEEEGEGRGWNGGVSVGEVWKQLGTLRDLSPHNPPPACSSGT